MRPEDQGTRHSAHRHHVIPRVLCFVLHEGNVLLLKGAPTKRLWPNRYNGLGGHVESDEDVYTAAVREIQEESGLDVTNVRLRGVIHIDTGDPVGVILFVFLADAVTHTPQASDEGALEWVPLSQVDEYDLVEDVAVILPRALAEDTHNGVFFAHYGFDEEGNLLITWPRTE